MNAINKALSSSYHLVGTEALEAVKAKCATPDNVTIIPLDLADGSNYQQQVQEALGKFNKIDLLINNGGISQRAMIDETDMAVDRSLMETNYFGTISLTKTVLHEMLQKGGGHIAVISSIAGKFGFALRSGYAASKHALHGFFESLRLEYWREGIKVTIVCPGQIKTDISVNSLDSKGDKWNKMDDYQDRGMDAAVCAKKIISAIKSEKEEINIGGKETIAVIIKRFFPSLFSKLIRRVKAT